MQAHNFLSIVIAVFGRIVHNIRSICISNVINQILKKNTQRKELHIVFDYVQLCHKLRCLSKQWLLHRHCFHTHTARLPGLDYLFDYNWWSNERWPTCSCTNSIRSIKWMLSLFSMLQLKFALSILNTNETIVDYLKTFFLQNLNQHCFAELSSFMYFSRLYKSAVCWKIIGLAICFCNFSRSVLVNHLHKTIIEEICFTKKKYIY